VNFCNLLLRYSQKQFK